MDVRVNVTLMSTPNPYIVLITYILNIMIDKTEKYNRLLRIGTVYYIHMCMLYTYIYCIKYYLCVSHYILTLSIRNLAIRRDNVPCIKVESLVTNCGTAPRDL